MRVWITKYALTQGIQEAEAERCTDINADMIIVRRKAQYTYYDQYFHSEGKDWHTDRDSAFARAEAMRWAKIKSLKKSIEKMEKLRFE